MVLGVGSGSVVSVIAIIPGSHGYNTGHPWDMLVLSQILLSCREDQWDISWGAAASAGQGQTGTTV